MLYECTTRFHCKINLVIQSKLRVRRKSPFERQIVLVLWLNPSIVIPTLSATAHTYMYRGKKYVVDDHCSHHFSTTAFPAS